MFSIQVSECGMSDTVGPIFVDMESQRMSQETQKSIDAEVTFFGQDLHFKIRAAV
jgi:ATP-dependent Zn protease